MSLNVITLTGEFANTYVAIKGDQALVIDPAVEWATLSKVLSGLSVVGVVLTHAHYDHFATLKPFIDLGIKVYLGGEDFHKMSDPEANGSHYFNTEVVFELPNYQLVKNEKINIGKFLCEFMLTPGHTSGSICLLTDNVLFSGDTLFYHDIGRTDFMTGSSSQMRRSLSKLLQLPSELIVYPGHDGETTILKEQKFWSRKK